MTKKVSKTIKIIELNDWISWALQKHKIARNKYEKKSEIKRKCTQKPKMKTNIHLDKKIHYDSI